ncbi:MAG: MBOAT family protein [Gammaproteobacteria bacterium]|nr:MBOAT family protein [Gammaproteobacteria bacterium]
MMIFELSSGFVGMVEIITVICMSLGLQFFIVDSFAANFALPPSLRAFWTKWWNRPTSGVLTRGIFMPSGGQRNRIRGLLLVFFACGLMHAAPLVLAGEQKMLWFILALGALGFFMIHALALSLEQFFPRKLRKGLFARIYFYLVMLISLPLYPAPGRIAFGAHNRPPETASVLKLVNYFNQSAGSYN